MKYGYHYTPCNSASGGPGLWLMLKLAVLAGAAAGVWWVLNAIGRAVTAAADAVAGAATAAGPIMLFAAVVVVALPVAAVVMLVVRNNQRPPLLPHDRPDRRALGRSTVEVIDVTPNRPRLSPPRPAYQAFASRDYAKVLR